MTRASNFVHLLAAAALVAGAIASIVPASAQDGQGPASTSAVRPPTRWTAPDGILQATIPQGWESNDRLAADNGALGFVHPSGMAMGEELPVWLLIERRPRAESVSFDAARRGVMVEGKIYGYVPSDSARTETADGRTLVGYWFPPSEEGHERSLAFLETPSGMLLFRAQAMSSEVWNKHSPTLHQILKSIRFLPPAAETK